MASVNEETGTEERTCTPTQQHKNMIISTLILCLSLGSYFLATSLQNVAITDGSDLDTTVGYISGGAYYATSCVGAILFPTINRLMNRTVLTIVALISYLMFYASMFVLREWAIYLGSVLSGAGGSILFILSLKSIADNSPTELLQRNMALFWAAVSTANIINNLVNYFYIQHLAKITNSIRVTVYGTLAGLCVIAIFLALLSDEGKERKKDEESQPQCEVYGQDLGADGEVRIDVSRLSDTSEVSSNQNGVQQAARKTNETQVVKKKVKEKLKFLVKLSRRRSAWIILVYQFFSGTLWGYLQKALPVSIGVTFTRRSMINLSGLVGGLCTLVGALVFKKLRDLTNNTFCTIVMMLMSVGACTLSYLVFPYDANISLAPTGSMYIDPEAYHVVIISVLLSLTDTGFNVLGFAVAALMFEGDTATAFSFLDTTFCVGNGVMITLAGFIDLHTYVILLTVLTIITGLGYIIGLRKYVIQL